MRSLLLAALLVPSLLACGDDVVNYSAPVGIDFKLQSNDVAGGGTFLLPKNISQPSGNPYGAFVHDAERALGRAPSRIVVTYAGLELLGSSSVANMSEVFQSAAPVWVGFVLTGADPGGTLYPVCNAVNPAGTGFPMAATFDSAALPAEDYAELLGGSFEVDLGGTATTAFAGGSETADLVVTFGLVAYK